MMSLFFKGAAETLEMRKGEIRSPLSPRATPGPPMLTAAAAVSGSCGVPMVSPAPTRMVPGPSCTRCTPKHGFL